MPSCAALAVAEVMGTRAPSELRRNSPLRYDLVLGEELRRRRLAAGLRQQDLAAACSLSRQAVRKYERASDRISAATLIVLARALGCSAAELVRFADGDAAEANEFQTLMRSPAVTDLLETYSRLSPRSVAVPCGRSPAGPTIPLGRYARKYGAAETPKRGERRSAGPEAIGSADPQHAMQVSEAPGRLPLAIIDGAVSRGAYRRFQRLRGSRGL
jgi:transcriptional regulator with XRE-family HTH domain